jgi:hypothetical protein
MGSRIRNKVAAAIGGPAIAKPANLFIASTPNPESLGLIGDAFVQKNRPIAGEMPDSAADHAISPAPH